MLEQTINWIQMAGTIVEGMVLLRMLSLRLQGTYTFITLYWAVNLLFDVSAWAFGWKSPAAGRLAVNEVIVLGLVFPFAVWDAFEEFVPAIAKVRRLYLPRLFSGLVFSVLLGFMLAIGADEQVQGAGMGGVFGLFFWLGSALASLLFVWNVSRASKIQLLVMPANTRVWSMFFLVTLVRTIVDFVANAVGPYLGQTVLEIVQLVLLFVDICLALWCILKLRSPQADTTGAAEKAGL